MEKVAKILSEKDLAEVARRITVIEYQTEKLKQLLAKYPVEHKEEKEEQEDDTEVVVRVVCVTPIIEEEEEEEPIEDESTDANLAELILNFLQR